MAALFGALIPLVLPGGLALSVCLTTHQLQVHGVGHHDACGGCDVPAPTEPAHSCCGTMTNTADAGTALRDVPAGKACDCCVEVATLTKEPTKRPETPRGPSALPPHAAPPLHLDALRPGEPAVVDEVVYPPPTTGSYVTPLLI